MYFIENARLGTNNAKDYIFTICLVIFGFTVVGQIPLLMDAYFRAPQTAGNTAIGAAKMANELDKNTRLFYLIIPFIVAFAALILSVKFVHNRNIRSIFTARARFSWKRFFSAFIVWGSVLSIFLFSQIKAGQTITWNFNPETFVGLLVLAVFFIPIQTTCEEVLFRGYLLQGFGKMYKKGWISILVTAILFGLLHGANPEVEKLGYGVLVYYLVTGLFLGILTVMDDGLELAMGYHAVNNIFATILLTNEWQAFQTDALFLDHSKPNFGWDSIATIAVIQPLLLLLFAKFYKWKDAKKKLFAVND